MALPFFVDSTPRAYRLKAGNADPPISTSAGTSPSRGLDRFNEGRDAIRMACRHSPDQTGGGKMLRDIVLHIGTEKTGTTSIQDALHSQASSLAAQGFGVPSSVGCPNHTGLAMAAAQPDWVTDLSAPCPTEQIADALAAEVATMPTGIHTLVLSNEHCHSRLPDLASVQRLHRILAPLAETIRVVVYLRRQPELAISRMSTLFRHGATISQALPPPGHDEFFYDYAALLDRWAEVFGRAAIDARLYAEAQRLEGGVVADFFHRLGVTPPVRTRALNPSLDPVAQEILRITNRAGLSLPSALREKLEERHRGAGATPTRGEVEAWLGYYATSNERVRAGWFPERDALFDNDVSLYPENRLPAPTVDELVLAALRCAEAALGAVSTDR
jgi:hypothetical protein